MCNKDVNSKFLEACRKHSDREELSEMTHGLLLRQIKSKEAQAERDEVFAEYLKLGAPLIIIIDVLREDCEWSSTLILNCIGHCLGNCTFSQK